MKISKETYNISTNCQPVRSTLFVETSATSEVFCGIFGFTVGRGDLTVAVVALGDTLPGSCVPTVIDAIEEMDGEAHPGKIIYMNDMDVDGDRIPDFLDGFGRIQDPIMEGDDSSDAIITGGEFVKLVLDCPLPAGLDPAIARLKFVYEANDPGAIDPMSLAASQAYATNAGEMNPLADRIRIWTKDACEARNPASVAENGDFVPAEILLPYESVMTGAVTRIYVEGVGTSPAWGGDKIRVQVYPYGSGYGYIEDQVSYTVVRCVYKVCVWRPYVCYKDGSGAVTNRAVYRPNYATPRTMFSDYINGYRHSDTAHHGIFAFMGHAFARVENRTPSVTDSFWTGQTGMAWWDFALTDVYDHFKDGELYWKRFSGKRDTRARLQALYDDYYANVDDPVYVTDGAKIRKMLAVAEIRVRPETGLMLDDYANKAHNFRGYGLDVTINKPARAGCGSYVGLLTQYAGLGNNTGWRVDKLMPVVLLISFPLSWAGVLWASIWDGNSVIDDALDEFCDNARHPETAGWGIGQTATALKFFDPSLMMDWIDEANGATGWSEEIGATPHYDATTVDNLNEWRR